MGLCADFSSQVPNFEHEIWLPHCGFPISQGHNLCGKLTINEWKNETVQHQHDNMAKPKLHLFIYLFLIV